MQSRSIISSSYTLSMCMHLYLCLYKYDNKSMFVCLKGPPGENGKLGPKVRQLYSL